MPTATLDKVNDAEISTANGRLSYRRAGQITGINTALAPADMLASALGSLPAYLSALSATYPNCLLMRHVVTPLAGSNNKAAVVLYYDTPTSNGGAGAGSFILERRRSLSRVETELHPKDKAPMKIGWNHPTIAAYRVLDTARLAYLTPIKSIIASGFYIGTPPAGLDGAFGKVNKTPWQGLQAGYWLYTGGDDRTADFGGHYSIRLEFLTRVTEDWSSYATLRDPSTGRILPVLPADTAALKAIAYSYGFNNAKNGLVKAGLYDTDEFNTTFGF